MTSERPLEIRARQALWRRGWLACFAMTDDGSGWPPWMAGWWHWSLENGLPGFEECPQPAPAPEPPTAQVIDLMAALKAGLGMLLLLLVLLPASLTAEALRGVPRVVDGDTLEVAGQKVRLHGIDAPELQQTCRRVTGAEWHCGWVSALRLEELIAGRPVRCEGEERDRYGRLVARCYAGAPQVDLGGWLVARGLAVAYRRYSTAYVGEEGHARVDRLGVWSGPFVLPADWRKGVR